MGRAERRRGSGGVSHLPLPSRFVALPLAHVGGVCAPVASTFRARLLGMAFIDRQRAGPGLLIPRCRAIHTFGMRFPLDVVFFDARGVEVRRARVPPRRLAREPRAAAVLELPAGKLPPAG